MRGSLSVYLSLYLISYLSLSCNTLHFSLTCSSSMRAEQKLHFHLFLSYLGFFTLFHLQSNPDPWIITSKYDIYLCLHICPKWPIEVRIWSERRSETVDWTVVMCKMKGNYKNKKREHLSLSSRWGSHWALIYLDVQFMHVWSYIHFLLLQQESVLVSSFSCRQSLKFRCLKSVITTLSSFDSVAPVQATCFAFLPLF